MSTTVMPSLKYRLIECRYFFSVIILLILVAVVVSFSFNKPDLFLALTPWHNRIADYFFIGFTQMGNGVFAICVALLLAVTKDFRAAVLVLLSFAMSGIASQVIKHLVTELRPYPYFQTLGITIHAIEGETAKASSASFPSGHTATIFSILCSLVMAQPFFKKNWALFLLLALLVAYSRMYVSNHFLQDLAGGALLGLLATIFSYWITSKWKFKWLDKQGFNCK